MKKLRKKIILSLALIFVASSCAFAAEYTEGDVIVVFKPQNQGEVKLSAVSLAESFASLAGAEVKETYVGLSNAKSNSNNEVFSLLHSDTMDAEEFAEELKNNPDVLAVTPNYKVSLATVPNDSDFNETDCWGMYAVDAPEVWDKYRGSSSVYVAMIDSGIDYSNPDMVDNYNSYYSSQYSSNKDYKGHGTHVAGIIGAKGNNSTGIAGINWDVNLIAVNALPSGDGTIADVMKGVNFVTELINSGVNIKVVNLSIEAYINLEPTYSNLVNHPFWRAFKVLDNLNQAVIVVAAGNKYGAVGEYISSQKGYVYPASFTGLNNMITVGAFNSNFQLASLSNTGADIAAPGVAILSTWVQNSASSEATTRLDTGTSMAAPFVSGAAALLASINPNLTAYQLKNLIINGCSGSSFSTGEKVFNLSDILNYYEENQGNSVSSTPTDDSEWQYQESNSSNGNSSSTSGGGGGGCNGLMLGIFTYIIILPLAKKLKR